MSPLEELARAVAQTGGLVHASYAHMEAVLDAGRVPPDAPPPPIVLFQLLCDILEERLGDIHEADITTAAEILDAVGDAMESDLFFLPLPTTDGPAGRTPGRSAARSRCARTPRNRRG
jgi:hypothetical protein